MAQTNLTSITLNFRINRIKWKLNNKISNRIRIIIINSSICPLIKTLNPFKNSEIRVVMRDHKNTRAQSRSPQVNLIKAFIMRITSRHQLMIVRSYNKNIAILMVEDCTIYMEKEVLHLRSISIIKFHSSFRILLK